MKLFIKPLYDLYRKLLRNSKYRWVVIVASLLYLVSPIDFATDLIPVVGWLDDGLIATILVTEGSQVLLEALKKRKKSEQSQEA